MKRKEEIQQLANDYWEGCDGCDANDKYFFVKGFECAYRQLGDDITEKKYTEEELIWAIQEAYGHGQDDEPWGVNKVEESIQDILKWLNKNKQD